MRYIIGLGNPGLEYKGTKHNIGFEAVRALAKSAGIKIKKKLHFSLVGNGKIGGVETMLVLPQTYVNLSGNAVGEIVGNYRERIEELLVICDDINLDLGRVRIKKQGSSGGHKGLESIIHTIGTDDFKRVRVGIATELHKGDITRYVLSPFKRKELRNAAHAIALAKEAAECFVIEGIDPAMNKFNKRKAGTS